MRVYESLEEIPTDFGPSVVTIGKFDGVHVGHQRMLSFLREEAVARSLTATALTFDRNPLAVLRPESCPEPLVSNERRLELLTEAGVDVTVMLEFDESFSKQPPDEFVEHVLADALRTRLVVVGKDYRFGAGGAGTVATLAELGERHGFETVVIDDVLQDGVRVSSTRLRELLEGGDVAGARLLLGRSPSVRGEVVRGAQRGRELGFPTANLSPELSGFIPADGVYAGWLVRGEERLPAAVSVGNNPTFEGVPQRQVEAHVLDADLDLYGEVVTVEFVDRVRPMLTFDGLDDLVSAMADDVARTRSILGLAA